MPIRTNLNESPYYDDYDITKQYHRVLFRPGYAVQARELTQLQTILRNSKDLVDMLNDDENMPEWVQSKITLAQDYITSVRDYLQSREEVNYTNWRRR